MLVLSAYSGTEINSIMTGPRSSNGFHEEGWCYSARLHSIKKLAFHSFHPTPLKSKSEAGPDFCSCCAACVDCDLVDQIYNIEVLTVVGS